MLLNTLRNSILQLITKPTRPNPKNYNRSTLIDLILTNRSNKIVATGVFDFGISDHCPVPCIIDTYLRRTQSRIIVKRNLRIFNEQAFINDLQHSDIHYTSEIPDVEIALDYFSKNFLAIMDKHAPFKQLRIKDRSNPWFSPELSTLFKARNRAWSLARHSGEPSHWLAFR